MDENKKRNILIIMLGVIILMLMFIIFLLFNNKHSDVNYGKLEIINNKEVEDNTTSDEENVNVGEQNTNINNNDDKVVINNNIDKDKTVDNVVNDTDIEDNNYKNETVDTNIVNYSEEDVISYFESNETEIKSGSFKDKFKDYFVEIVDFIFYGTEIKGHTFDELTNTGKLKIISVALKIDSYIEEKSPGYKETIKSTSSRVYNNAKEKLTTLFFDISSNICKNREDGCNKAKELFGDIKSTCKIGWSFIKELLKNSGGKLKEWYEVYSGK